MQLAWAVDTDLTYSIPQYPGIAITVLGPTQKILEGSWDLVCDEEDCDHASDMCYYYKVPM